MYSEEEQKQIEAVFMASWDRMEDFFQEFVHERGWTHLKHMLTLMGMLRERGYDRYFRAGQSLSFFIISRSREHGLRQNQPRLMFDIGQNGEMGVALRGDRINVNIQHHRVEITPGLENLLIPLLAYPID